MKRAKDMVRTAIAVDIAKNIVCLVPGLSSMVLRGKISEGCKPDLDKGDYLLSVFHKHGDRLMAARGSLAGADVMEIGPGSNVGVTVLMGLAGARSLTCLDNIPWVPDEANVKLYSGLVAAVARDPDSHFVAPAFRERAVRDPIGLARELLDSIRYLAPEDISKTTLPDRSFDLIFSQACFEHFADPENAVRQIARLLRPQGVTSHQVDCRDHRDPIAHPFGHLRYAESLWRMANSHRPHGVRNRWRVPDYRDAFARHGLQIVSLESTCSVPVTDSMQRSFNHRFHAMSREDLGIVSFVMVACKPAEGSA